MNRGKHFFLSNAIHLQTKPLTASIIRPVGLNLHHKISTIPSRLLSYSSKTHAGWKDLFNGEGASRYARLNRFQQFQNGRDNFRNRSSKNSLRNLTAVGLLFMGATYYGAPYLFQYVPPFTYFQSHPSHLVYGLLGINCGIFALWHVCLLYTSRCV